MDRQIDGSWFQASNGGNFFAFLAFLHGVTGDVSGGVMLDGEEQVVDGVMQIEKTDERLQTEAKLRGMGSGECGGGDRWLGGGVKSFDFGPFEADHVEGELQAAGGIAWMLVEPGFEARTEIAHGERARGAIDEIVFRKRVKAAVAEDGAEAWKIVGEGVQDSKPILAIVDFETV